MALTLKPIKRTDLARFKEYDGHELVVQFKDSLVGLNGFIAIHNSNLGPATGGTRMFAYETEDDALADALRLSRAMTYKCAVAGVRHGGGKAVIIGDPVTVKTPALIEAYARAVHELNGKFTTGEDVGISEDDVQLMLATFPHFIGRRGVAGDPSPYASLSTFNAIQVALKDRYGTENIRGRVVAVKGVGKVGSELARLLREARVIVVAADIDEKAITSLTKEFSDLKVADTTNIHKLPADVYAPCAMGGEFTEKTAQELGAHIVCGSANNQLASQEIGDELHRRGITYVPDYVANAGGLINVVDELEECGYNRERVLARIGAIRTTLNEFFKWSREQHRPLCRVADAFAEEKFKLPKPIV